MYNLAKEIITTDKSLGSFSVSVLPQNILQDQTELINYEAISMKYYECVSVFLPELSGIQIAPFLCSIIFSSMASLALPFSSTLSLERHNF